MEGRSNSRPRFGRRTGELETQICLAQNPFVLLPQQQDQQPSQFPSFEHRLGGNQRGVQTNSDQANRCMKPKLNRSRIKKNSCNTATGAKVSNNVKADRGFKFSASQRSKLAAAFSLKRYPSSNDVQFLAHEIHVRIDQIKNWFHDQRRRHKKSLDIFATNQQEVCYHLNLDTQQFVDKFTNSNVRSGVNHMQHKPKSPSKIPSRAFKFDEVQRLKLRSFFGQKQYPNPNEMTQLARELGVMRDQVKNWFHDQRRKLKQETQST